MKSIRWTFIFFFLFGIVCLWVFMTSRDPLFVALRSIVRQDAAFKCTDPYAYMGWHPARFFEDSKTQKLAKAIQKNDIPKIKKLVAQGADVNAIGKGAVTPLVYAICAEDETFHCLLELGANPLLPRGREAYEMIWHDEGTNRPKEEIENYWNYSALGRLCQGDGTHMAWIRFRKNEKNMKNGKLKDALEYAKKFSRDGTLPQDILFLIEDSLLDTSERLVEAIDAGADVCYQKDNASIVSMATYLTSDRSLLIAMHKMLQGGADMCAVSRGKFYCDDVCLFVAQNESNTPEYKALVAEIERQGADVKLVRSMYLQRIKELEEQGEDPLLISGMAEIDVSRTPPEERPWLRGVYEKRAQETADEIELSHDKSEP